MGDNLPPLPPYMYGREVGKNERVWSEQCMRSYAEEAVWQEREAIMELALQKSATFPADSDYTRGYALAKQAFAAAIRARSEQGGEG